MPVLLLDILCKHLRMQDVHQQMLNQVCLIQGMKELLLKLNFIREDLGLQARAKSRDYRSE